MSKFIVFALLAVLLVCIVQVYSAPAEGATTPSSIDDTIKSISEAFNNGFKDVKPKLEEIFSQGKELLTNFAQKAGEQADKLAEKSR